MHTKRAELAESVRTTLQAELDATDKGAFTVTAVNVRNMLTDKAIESAIRQRAETDQAIEKKRKEIDLAKAEAERLIVQAEGEGTGQPDHQRIAHARAQGNPAGRDPARHRPGHCQQAGQHGADGRRCCTTGQRGPVNQGAKRCPLWVDLLLK